MLETKLQDSVYNLWDNADYIDARVDKTNGTALYKMDNNFFIIWYYDHFKIKDVQKVTMGKAKFFFPNVAV